MAIFEQPRLPVMNPGEQHLACAVLIDTSGSMAPYAQELEDAICAMRDAILDDDIARGRVELSIITFDDDVNEVIPFGPITSMSIPRINCGGMTHTHEAINFALNRVEERKQLYKTNGITYNQPWIWLFTDGQANDPDNGAVSRLIEAQNNNKCVFYGVGIGNDVDEPQLVKMHKNGMVLRVSKSSFSTAFELLGQSVTSASTNNTGNPDDDLIPNGNNSKNGGIIFL